MVIHKQLRNYFTSNMFPHFQYGFRPKHPTEHVVLQLYDYIIYQLDLIQTYFNNFTDLSKAFDKS